jgi:hypothetical protein
MLLDVGSDNPSLARSEPTWGLRLDVGCPAIEACKFMHEQNAEHFKIEPIGDVRWRDSAAMPCLIRARRVTKSGGKISSHFEL